VQQQRQHRRTSKNHTKLVGTTHMPSTTPSSSPQMDMHSLLSSRYTTDDSPPSTAFPCLPVSPDQSPLTNTLLDGICRHRRLGAEYQRKARRTSWMVRTYSKWTDERKRGGWGSVFDGSGLFGDLPMRKFARLTRTMAEEEQCSEDRGDGRR
jgi:hypothetical protein